MSTDRKQAIEQYIEHLRQVREEGTTLGILKPSYAAYMVMAETAAQKELSKEDK